uniref:Uncharacterized protein n=1 Tax=Anguilla anguilla TaxID=7936 RepID=A0A0E9PLK2_ANGAN
MSLVENSFHSSGPYRSCFETVAAKSRTFYLIPSFYGLLRQSSVLIGAFKGQGENLCVYIALPGHYEHL